MFLNWNKTKVAGALIAALCMAGISSADQRSSSSRLGVSDYYISQDTISTIGDNSAEVVIELITNGSNDTLPIDLAFILDNSGSMGMGTTKMTDAKAATDTVINHMNFANGDRGAIVTFHDYATVRQEYTSNDSLLHAAVSPIYPQDGTVYSTGLQAALDLVGSGNPEYFIFLSDGENSGSDDYSALLDTAVSHNIKIFTIGLGTDNFDSLSLIDMAGKTGGKYYHVPISDSLPTIFSILYEFINDQVITDIRLDAYPNNDEFGNFEPIIPSAVSGKWSDITNGKHCEFGSLAANEIKEIKFNLTELIPDVHDTAIYTVIKGAVLSYNDRAGYEHSIELDSLTVTVVGDTIPDPISEVVVKSANKNTHDGYKEYNAQIELYNIDTTTQSGWGDPIPMQELTIRYWYDRDIDGSIDESHVEFFDNWGTTEVHNKDFAGTSIASVVKNEADSYVEIRFAPEAGVLDQKICVQFQVKKTSGNWSDVFDVDNDYSYNGESEYTENKKITVYRNGKLIAGTEPN